MLFGECHEVIHACAKRWREETTHDWLLRRSSDTIECSLLGHMRFAGVTPEHGRKSHSGPMDVSVRP